MKIRKAVIPAAGFGTRVLPATKAIPKEMFPIVDKPAIQYIVEEAINSGIREILIITTRGKECIENHFDKSPELESVLLTKNKTDLLINIKSISNLADIHFIRQKEPKGLGHAILCANSFVGNDSFAVLYADDIIINKKPVCKQLTEVYENYNLGVVAAHKVRLENIGKYSSLKLEKLESNIFKCYDMVEKPSKNQIMSDYSILGRCVLPAEIFEILKKIKPGAGNEIQLTDAMKILAQTVGMLAVDFEGKRYDIGNKLGIMEACVDVALSHPEIGARFKKYLIEVLNYDNI
ncbi:MAG: UTP--glucose-1-phosphate uridylyltransferase GalU [Candidatus Paraimprobicoccus trichonymphae]|uniref:UTP--glucose-1-phosphate uridylyltransferase n=1 Tax=Candidatus Paraimprobicoccus trichonymphae TaxID=3033793 RepID=A0AA48HZG4_9FIRM|nr:MAG: UTP--glucose-1-phosphate uridylyltransferase GalU [Candidatus Paraimprobicoccus trichonymphae]